VERPQLQPYQSIFLAPSLPAAGGSGLLVSKTRPRAAEYAPGLTLARLMLPSAGRHDGAERAGTSYPVIAGAGLGREAFH